MTIHMNIRDFANTINHRLIALIDSKTILEHNAVFLIEVLRNFNLPKNATSIELAPLMSIIINIAIANTKRFKLLRIINTGNHFQYIELDQRKLVYTLEQAQNWLYTYISDQLALLTDINQGHNALTSLLDLTAMHQNEPYITKIYLALLSMQTGISNPNPNLLSGKIHRIFSFYKDNRDTQNAFLISAIPLFHQINQSDNGLTSLFTRYCVVKKLCLIPARLITDSNTKSSYDKAIHQAANQFFIALEKYSTQSHYSPENTGLQPTTKQACEAIKQLSIRLGNLSTLKEYSALTNYYRSINQATSPTAGSSNHSNASSPISSPAGEARFFKKTSPAQKTQAQKPEIKHVDTISALRKMSALRNITNEQTIQADTFDKAEQAKMEKLLPQGLLEL